MSPYALKSKAAALHEATVTVYYAARDPRMPWLARALALLVAAYALSPIDLLPDVIPVIGYLDDLLLVPLGLALVIRLTPSQVIVAAREKAAAATAKPVSLAGAAIVVALWLLAAAILLRWTVATFGA